MPTRKTLDEFIADANKTHNNKYDYSQVAYKNNRQKVKIICPIHGEFMQTPHDHLSKKAGCPRCKGDAARTLRYGWGINDYDGFTIQHGKLDIAYSHWTSMLERCFVHERKSKSYVKCKICDEWKYFSNFRKWFYENYNPNVSDCQIDKDIIIKGNKLYSPDTCCLIPSRINLLFVQRGEGRGKSYNGVEKIKKSRFRATLSNGKENVKIGIYDTAEDAFYAYKKAKEDNVKSYADNYYSRGLIDKRVYDALYRYKINMND